MCQVTYVYYYSMLLKSNSKTRQDYAYHPGPAQGYLSKATNNDLSTYKGDGDWFKIGEYGVLNRTFWVLQLENVYWVRPSSQIPSKLGIKS